MNNKKRSDLHENQTKAKRIKILLKNYEKKFRGDYQEMANFKEPVLMLMRNTRRTEFYDNATSGWFHFEHTDGTKRRIKLSPEFLQTFDYGKRTFKGYICHEDNPTPLPERPIVTAEQFQWAIDKTQQDIKDWKATELNARGEMWMKVFKGVGLLILALALANILVPDFFSNIFGGLGGGGTAEPVRNAVTTIVQENITKLP